MKSRAEKGVPMRFIHEVALPFVGQQECLTWPFARSGTGYGMVKYEGNYVGVHRVVCEMVHGPAPTGKHEAAHSCGKGHEGCVNPNHLLWKTSKENKADKIAHGTHNRGELNHKTVLTEDDVRLIRDLRGRVTGRALACRFGVSPSNIWSIQKRISWAWL